MWVHQTLLFLMVMFWHLLTDKEQNNIEISSNFGMYFEIQHFGGQFPLLELIQK